LSEYENATTKILVQCDQTTHNPWWVVPTSITQGTWCPTCAGNTKECGEANFRAKVEELGGIIHGVYINNRIPILIECENSHLWSTTPDNVTQGKWCPDCAGNTREHGEEKFKTKVLERGGRVIGEYLNAHTGVLIVCANNHEWSPLPLHVVHHNSWCPQCFDRYTPEEFEEVFYQTVISKGGQVTGTYVNSTYHANVCCNKAHTWRAVPWNVVNGTWCPHCYGRTLLEGETNFLNKVQENEGTVLEDYIDSKTPLWIQCKFGHQWKTAPSCISATNGIWCPKCCFKSKGESVIAKYLDSKGIRYIREAKLIHGKLYRYDFFLPDFNIIIEFDGIQHFQPVEFFSKCSFEERRAADLYKDNFAYSSGIHLLRIPYTMLNNVDTIIDHMFQVHQTFFTTPIGSNYYSNPKEYFGIYGVLCYKPTTFVYE
jgi:very-short-patch-repair endonuclease